jgi:hypothetical protein
MNFLFEDITMCVVDCAMPKLALRALRKSMEVCEFSDVLLFSDIEINCGQDIRFICIEKIKSMDEYSKFLMKNLHTYIKTKYVLIVQWDGYIIDPLAWSDEFKDYDYIGAKWPWYKDHKAVGNGGFSFRSKKLLDIIASIYIPFLEGHPEDDQICRIYREKLENQFDIKFGLESTADQFSYERSTPDFPTFGFHGIFNLWRYLTDDEVSIFANELSAFTFASAAFYEFFLQFFLMRRFKPLLIIYEKLKQHQSQQQIFKGVMGVTKDEIFTQYFIDLCERSSSRGLK